MGAESYTSTTDVLTDRIVALGPQILPLDSPWALFKVAGFDCSDIGPSLYQAQFALAKAQAIVQKQMAERARGNRQ